MKLTEIHLYEPKLIFSPSVVSESIVSQAPSVRDVAPLFTWENSTGSTTITYAQAVKNFIMAKNCQTDGGTFPSPDHSLFDMYFLEVDNIIGPYRLITYLKQFGPTAYFAGFTSKFNFGPDFPSVGYLSYSQWGELTAHGGSNPPNNTYRWDILPVKFSKR